MKFARATFIVGLLTICLSAENSNAQVRRLKLEKGSVVAGVAFGSCASGERPNRAINIVYEYGFSVKQGPGSSYNANSRSLARDLRSSVRAQCNAGVNGRLLDLDVQVDGRPFGSTKECPDGQLAIDGPINSIGAIAFRFRRIARQQIYYGFGWRFRWTPPLNALRLVAEANNIALSFIPPLLRANLQGGEFVESPALNGFRCERVVACAAGIRGRKVMNHDGAELDDVCKVDPSPDPSPEPSASPSPMPSAEPSPQPSAEPSAQPSVPPSPQPSIPPSTEPSAMPSANPMPNDFDHDLHHVDLGDMIR